MPRPREKPHEKTHEGGGRANRHTRGNARETHTGKHTRGGAGLRGLREEVWASEVGVEHVQDSVPHLCVCICVCGCGFGPNLCVSMCARACNGWAPHQYVCVRAWCVCVCVCVCVCGVGMHAPAHATKWSMSRNLASTFLRGCVGAWVRTRVLGRVGACACACASACVPLIARGRFPVIFLKIEGRRFLSTRSWNPDRCMLVQAHLAR